MILARRASPALRQGQGGKDFHIAARRQRQSCADALLRGCRVAEFGFPQSRIHLPQGGGLLWSRRALLQSTARREKSRAFASCP